jgi:hypothetical protein
MGASTTLINIRCPGCPDYIPGPRSAQTYLHIRLGDVKRDRTTEPGSCEAHVVNSNRRVSQARQSRVLGGRENKSSVHREGRDSNNILGTKYYSLYSIALPLVRPLNVLSSLAPRFHAPDIKTSALYPFLF